MVKKIPFFKFAVYSDAHVTAEDGISSSPFDVNKYSNSRFEFVVDCLNKLELDFVLNLGDLVHPTPFTGEYDLAATRYKEISSKLRHRQFCIPGNHDVGDKPSRWMPSRSVSNESISAYIGQFGKDYFSFSHKNSTFIMLNAALFNSQLERCDAQKAWLEKELDSTESKQIFIAMHYPPFLYESNECDHYDNISEPDRAWFLSLVKKFSVTSIFAGHVHNFWFNTYDKTDIFVIPSVSFVRQDYSEMYSVKSNCEGGRDDKKKLGFLTFDIFENSYIWRFHRTFGRNSFDSKIKKVEASLTSFDPSMKRNPSFGVDLRIPWITSHQIPPSGALDEFYRKDVRNDYTFLALYELGINRLRLPLNDIVDDKTRSRLVTIKKLGFSYTFYSLGIPSPQIISLLKKHSSLIEKIEIVWSGEDELSFEAKLREFRIQNTTKVFISPLWENYGSTDSTGKHLHVINHGFKASKYEEIVNFFPDKWEKEGILGFIDGIVLRINMTSNVDKELMFIDNWQSKSQLGLDILASVSTPSPAGYNIDEREIKKSLNNLWFKAKKSSSTVTFFMDFFMEVDRGYFRKSGVIDRLCNPMAAWHALIKNN